MRRAADVIRQILTESVLLSLIGGAAGLAVAYAGSHMMLALAFPHAPNMPFEANPSLPVLAFAFLVSLLTGVTLELHRRGCLRMRSRPMHFAA